jgi:hypothetical protein
VEDKALKIKQLSCRIPYMIWDIREGIKERESFREEK